VFNQTQFKEAQFALNEMVQNAMGGTAKFPSYTHVVAAEAVWFITAAFSYHVKAALEAGTLTALLDEFQPAALPLSVV